MTSLRMHCSTILPAATREPLPNETIGICSRCGVARYMLKPTTSDHALRRLLSFPLWEESALNEYTEFDPNHHSRRANPQSSVQPLGKQTGEPWCLFAFLQDIHAESWSSMPRAAWATTARQPPPENREDPVTVLVTGFGPFLAKYPRNSSWEIASTLPALIPATDDHPTPIHIHVHHEPVRVAYNHVIKLIPHLLPPVNPMNPKPDIILHIGLAAGRPYYTLEMGAHGRGYGAIADVDGEKFPDDIGDEKFPPDLYPYVLHTSFDTSDVVTRWRSYLGHAPADVHLPADAQMQSISAPEDVRLSPDAGNFLCGFIYYNSLAHYFSMKKDERPVAFMHVPDLSDSDEKLSNGRNVAIALIKALVESRRQVGVVDGPESVARREEEQVITAETDVNFS